MRRFDFEPARFSKREFLIGGITVHVYNSDPLEDYVKKLDAHGDHFVEIPINVLYLIHGRQGSYQDTESYGYKIVDAYYSKKEVKVPLVFVTFDVRNHGARLVNELNNKGWKHGNETHAQDMVSIVDGTVLDLKLIMQYLPAYLSLDQHIKHLANYTFKYRNILSGYSLGGHTVYRFTSQYPDLVDAINPVIGSCDLSSLLLNRLLKIKDSDKRRFLQAYDEIEFADDTQRSRYPKEFHELVSRADSRIFDDFPAKKLFASFGQEDTLVPHKYSRLWVNMYVASSSVSEVYVEEGAGHEVTEQMLERFAAWLSEVLTSLEGSGVRL